MFMLKEIEDLKSVSQNMNDYNIIVIIHIQNLVVEIFGIF